LTIDIENDRTAKPPRVRARSRGRYPEWIQVVLDKDPAARSALEVFLYPSVHALFFHRIAHWLYARGLPLLPRAISQFARLVTGGIEIHPGAEIGHRFFIDHGSGVVIGETTRIGDDVMLYHQVTLGATGWWKHTSGGGKRRHPIIEDGVAIGVGASILGPVTIGARSRIGALAIVTEDVPHDSTVVGPQARFTMRRGEPVCDRMVRQLGERHSPTDYVI
jgi:serine O-acetyltransferase